MHVFCDNTSALRWVVTNKARDHAHTMLLLILCALQEELGILVTSSHIPGVRNVIADAISRSFNVPTRPL